MYFFPLVNVLLALQWTPSQVNIVAIILSISFSRMYQNDIFLYITLAYYSKRLRVSFPIFSINSKNEYINVKYVEYSVKI